MVSIFKRKKNNEYSITLLQMKEKVRWKYEDVCNSNGLYKDLLEKDKPILVHYFWKKTKLDDIMNYMHYVNELFDGIDIRHIYMDESERFDVNWINMKMLEEIRKNLY